MSAKACVSVVGCVTGAVPFLILLGWLKADWRPTLTQDDQRSDWTNLQFVNGDLEAGHDGAGFQ
jgi:hypothetical protein